MSIRYDYNPRTELYHAVGDYIIDLERDGLTGYAGSAANVAIARNGLLLIGDGFACDGPSGPTLDTTAFIYAAFVHDALYALIRAGVLPQSYRKKADQVMLRINRAYGMSAVRAWYTYTAVRWFGGAAARGSK